MSTTFFRETLRPLVMRAAAREIVAARKPTEPIAALPRLFDPCRAFTSFKVLTPKDAPLFKRYLSADDKGWYRGDAHMLFGLSAAEFGRRSGLRLVRVRGGENGLMWMLKVSVQVAARGIAT
jgi:hypothetical protein